MTITLFASLKYDKVQKLNKYINNNNNIENIEETISKRLEMLYKWANFVLKCGLYLYKSPESQHLELTGQTMRASFQCSTFPFT